MSYVDGYLLSVKKDKLEDYRKIADNASKVWRKYGALDYKECVADDVEIQDFQHFPEIIKTEKDEVTIFSYILFNSREHRDEVNKKVMADPQIHEGMDMNNLPFDCKRMAYGGFKTIVGD